MTKLRLVTDGAVQGAQVRRRRRGWEARLGEFAVYPGHGVGRIEEIRTQKVAGQDLEFVVLRMMEDESRILIPRDRVNQVGLRGILPRKEVAQIWDILRTRRRGRRPSGMTWSRQFREYQKKLRAGSVFEIAEVLRDLLRLQLQKELSFAERKVLDSARSLVVQELAVAARAGTDRIEAEIKASVR